MNLNHKIEKYFLSVRKMLQIDLCKHKKRLLDVFLGIHFFDVLKSGKCSDLTKLR